MPPPAKQVSELTDKEIKVIMKRAHEIVDSNFDAQEHLPSAVYKFLGPIVNSTCQGYYSCALMMLGGMPALMNGATVQIWSQKPTPLVAAVFQIANPQAGKSRLFSILEEIFDTCDDVVAEHVGKLLLQARPSGMPGNGGSAQSEPQVTVKSINLQSFTMPEFFARCSAAFPQVVFDENDSRAALGIDLSPWKGRAFNLDEAYELWGHLDLTAKSRGEKDGAPSVHASTLNTLISSGKTRRATRSSTNFGESRGTPVSISIVGNGHPTKFIPLDRGMVGCHTAATKERFLIAVDHASARHADLPADTTLPQGAYGWKGGGVKAIRFMLGAPKKHPHGTRGRVREVCSYREAERVGRVVWVIKGYRWCRCGTGARWVNSGPPPFASPFSRTVEGVKPWTWLPLTPQQAAVFLWESYFDDPDRAHEAGLEQDALEDGSDDGDGEMRFRGPRGGYKLGFPDGNETRLRHVVTPSGLRTEFPISSRWLLPDPTKHIQDAARKLALHFLDKPKSVMPLEDEGRKLMLGNQVAQSIRAQQSTDDISVAALHANAAGQQGVYAALMAGLDFAAGGGQLHPDSNLPVVTVEHVNSARRLVDISVSIREMWRQNLEKLFGAEVGADGGDVHSEPSRPVRGSHQQHGFDAPMPTQLPQPPFAPYGGVGEIAETQPAEMLRGASQAIPHLIWRSQLDALASEPNEPDNLPEDEVEHLTFNDVLPEEQFDEKGFGDDGVMLLAGRADQQGLRDRVLVRRLLLSGKCSTTINQLVDSYYVTLANGTDSKRRKVRPSKPGVIAVVQAAFQQFPRLGSYGGRGGDREVVLKKWGQSDKSQKLFHNELMNCCRLSLSEVSQKRAVFYDARPQIPVVSVGGEDAAVAPSPAVLSVGAAREAPNTPPGGVAA